jgi:predicted nuclease of predicted toxin-antitoxin system
VRILLDECVHAGVRAAFPGHFVRTVTQAGWRTLSDRALLEVAPGNFDVLVTIDQRLVRELRVERYAIGFLLVRVRSNAIENFRPLYEGLLAAAERVRPGDVIIVGSA